MLYIELNMSDRDTDEDMRDNTDDLFLGGKKVVVREGYDSYSIYDPSTKKRTGRYISKSPAAAAMKAARRLFKTGKKSATKKGKKGGAGDGETTPPPTMEDFGGADCTSQYKDLGTCMGVKGGAKSSDLYKKEAKTIKFMLRKTTRGVMSGGKRVFYYFAATLKTYKTPLVVMRGGVRVVIKNKIFVESLELPSEFKQMMEARKAKKVRAKSKVDVAAKKEAAKAKKEAAKAKKQAAKEKAREKKEAAKARKEAAKAAKKAAKASKPKAAKKSKAAKKTKRPPKMGGGGSCNMYY